MIPAAMKRTRTVFVIPLLLLATQPVRIAAQSDLADTYRSAARRIMTAVREEGRQFDRLVALCDGIGPRLPGSEGDRASRDWCEATMRADGLENVRQEMVHVPHWVRGEEEARLVLPARRPLVVTALGGSVGTDPEGIEADVVVVSDFEELAALPREQVSGRIVLFNVPMRRTDRSMAGYGEAVAYRTGGPSAASRRGAVACLVRSVGTGPAANPHTGVTQYADDTPPIPAAALTMADAGALARLAASGERVRVFLRLGARTLPHAEGANVIGELPGWEHPEEVVVIGGHLDSWDLGTGAHDDAAGCIMAMETARLLAALDLRPRRTIRVVLFAAEEMGELNGGVGYAIRHSDSGGERHVAAIESDAGVGPLYGFSAGGTTEAGYESLRSILSLLEPLGATELRIGGGGPDIGPLANRGVPALLLWPDASLYFDYHHSAEDVVENVEPDLLADHTAAMAIMAYILADMETPLPRADGG